MSVYSTFDFSAQEEYERRRAEILVAVERAGDSLARGEGLVITEESMGQLVRDVAARGRARLAAERRYQNLNSAGSHRRAD